MAVVVNGARDFILFSHPPNSAFDASVSSVDSDVAGLPFDMAGQFSADEAELAAQTFDVSFQVKE